MDYASKKQPAQAPEVKGPSMWATIVDRLTGPSDFKNMAHGSPDASVDPEVAKRLVPNQFR